MTPHEAIATKRPQAYRARQNVASYRKCQVQIWWSRGTSRWNARGKKAVRRFSSDLPPDRCYMYLCLYDPGCFDWLLPDPEFHGAIVRSKVPRHSQATTVWWLPRPRIHNTRRCARKTTQATIDWPNEIRVSCWHDVLLRTVSSAKSICKWYTSDLHLSKVLMSSELNQALSTSEATPLRKGARVNAAPRSMSRSSVR